MSRALPFALVLLLLAAMPACTSQQEIEYARARGAKAGYESGRSVGNSEGYAAAFRAAHDETYRSTLHSLRSTGQFNRRPLYTAAVLAGAFLLGLSLQYLGMYILRILGFPDIDRIVLPRHLTELDLTQLRTTGRPNRTVRGPTSCVLLVLLLPPLVGCAGAEKEAWQQGYDTWYPSGYNEGRQAGELRGQAEGEAAGKASARRAAETGEAWQLYTSIGAWTFLLGAGAGVSVQYGLLIEFRRCGRLRQLPAIVLVPAMKHSLAYTHFEKCRQLQVETERELEKLDASRRLTKAQIGAANENSVLRLKAIQELDEFSKVKLGTLFAEELSRIVSECEEKARRARGSVPGTRETQA